jgi:peptidoglycan/LPS O-acetylase OafA/YrhL
VPNQTADAIFARHLRALDGLRGIAVLLVVLPHVQLTGTLPGPSIVQRITHDLGHGVEIFFVLSGFGLALPLLQSLRRDGSANLDIAVYAFNRAFRIIPLYYVAIVLTILLNLLYSLLWGTLPPELALAHTPVQMLAQLFFFDRNVVPVDASFWSIPVQLRWYLVFPLFLQLYVRSPRAFAVVLVALVAAYNFTILHVMDVATLPLFLLGIVAADQFVRGHPLQRYGPVIAIAGLALGHIGDRWATAPDQFGGQIVWAMQPTSIGWQLAAFGLVLAAASGSRLRSFLSAPPLVWLGIASFSIYLIHEPVVEIGARAFGPKGGLIDAALGLVAGGLVWVCIERRITASAVRQAIRAQVGPHIKAALRVLDLPAEVLMTDREQFSAPANAPAQIAPMAVHQPN